MPGITEQPAPRVTAADLVPEDAWAAVERRDPAADGMFVYAVRTTGIYCRPVCASRRPLRRNVSFFPDGAAAEAAGFRPCRRCRPAGDGADAAAACVDRARAFLDANLDRAVTLDELGRAAFMSPFHLQRTFRRLLGVSPREYVRARRAERLKAHLRDGATVSRATFEAGFGSGSRVYERADAELGMTPAAYRRGGHGERIRFAVLPCQLGWLLVGITDRGVCAAAMADSEAELQAQLRLEFPGAELERTDELQPWIQEMLHAVNGETAALQLPLDLRATAFQQRVWKALRDIPAGQTRSYGDIAAAIGSPRSARAVARACASNRIAVAIPCHRVIRSNGEPGGYRWGADRKRLLLQREASPARPADNPATER